MKRRHFQIILLKIKWNPWNPWCLGKMNLAWTKYTRTSMYEDRKQLEKGNPTDFKDFAYNSFIENYEVKHFVNCFTKKEKIKLFFAPFSFGNNFRMPFWKLEDQILGFKE